MKFNMLVALAYLNKVYDRWMWAAHTGSAKRRDILRMRANVIVEHDRILHNRSARFISEFQEE